jgi:tripartite-type tricarboxylate transporter receptor subunit TctC
MVRCLLVFALLTGAGVTGAQVPEPATRPVRIIVNLPPASSMDLIARAVAEAMSQDGGAVVLVENRPGAAGMLAAEAVARAAPDGQTLLISGVDAIVFAFVSANRKPFDPFTDFTPVARLTRDHWVLAVSPALGVSSVAELIAFARVRVSTRRRCRTRTATCPTSSRRACPTSCTSPPRSDHISSPVN